VNKQSFVNVKVSEAFQNDIGRGIARIDSKAKDELGVSTGDIIKLTGKKSTLAIVWQAHPDDEGLGIVRIDGILRQNSGVGLGDSARVEKAEIREAKKVTLAPKEAIRYSPGFDNYVKRRLVGKPLMKGNIIPIGVFGTAVPLMVSQVIPQGGVMITESTTVEIKDEPVKELSNIPTITYDDIGGLKDAMRKVREMVELPLRHPELFERLGVEPPKGVLLYGSPGTGKTLLAKAVANESDANFFYVGGPEVVSKFVGESEERLRKLFKEAQDNAPSIIFIDEIDAIAPKRSEVTGEVERRMVSQLLTLMDGLKARGEVIVIAATNRIDSIDPALRRPGRFDREIELGVPSRDDREEILAIHARNMPLAKDVDIKKLAGITHGYTGADLSSLAKEAAMKSLRRLLPLINLDDAQVPTDILDKLKVKGEDFSEAMREIQPSALREVFFEKPNIKWADIGGLEGVKRELKEAVELPLKKPEVFEKMGIRPVKGILLYGPPGSGKTLLAKAVATECEANFIGLSGTQVLSKWVGESLSYDEEIVFFDEDNTPQRIKIGEYIDSTINLNSNENSQGIQITGVAQKHKIFSFDDNGKITCSQISDVLRHPFIGDHLYEVETRTGRKIQLTKDHGLFTLQGQEIAETKTSDLISGVSYVAIPSRLMFLENPTKSISIKKLIGRKYHKLLDGKLSLFNSPKTKIPVELEITPELGYIIGLWLAEGDYNNGIRIHNQNPEIRRKLLECVKKLEMPYFENHKILLITSLLWRRVFEEVLGLKSGAFNKRFPAFAFGVSKSVLSNMLSGYFSGDGSVSGNSHRYYVEATTVSEKMADDLQNLLLYFGIVAIKYKKYEKRYEHDKYVIQFSGVDNFRKFLEVNFTDSVRAEIVSKYILSKKWTRTKQIPLSNELKEFIMKNGCGAEWRKSETIGSRILEAILNKIDPDKKSGFWQLIEQEIYWDKVMSIKKIEYSNRYVYDLSIDKYERFMAGSFFVHNSEKTVRELFRKARAAAPTIIFLDEIDSIAPKRGGEEGHQVMERVVDTLLTELDGLKSLKSVVVIAATNRPDILDPALMRPGRFDRIIEIPLPNEAERYEIFKVHSANMPLEKNVDLKDLSKMTEEYSGADIENLCREAGMVAIRSNDAKVSQDMFESAIKLIKPKLTKEDIESVDKFKAKVGGMYG